jgi:hypothetical protein
MDLDAVKESGFYTESDLMKKSAFKRAKILDSSGLLDNPEVMEQFKVSHFNAEEYKNSLLAVRTHTGFAHHEASLLKSKNKNSM